jgi:uncharacterized membrane protein
MSSFVLCKITDNYFAQLCEACLSAIHPVFNEKSSFFRILMVKSILMEPNHQRISELETQVQQLSQLLGAKFNELNSIRQELEKLKTGAASTISTVSSSPQSSVPESPAPTNNPATPAAFPNKPSQFSRDYAQYQKERQAKLENLIGTNLFNKIGILILMVGVFIGVKYAIDKDLVSPMVRIITGYGFALSLGIVGWRLKTKYEEYSAVMMGGAIGTAYFITYIAYSLYGLIPQLPAFGFMLLTTAAAVYTSLKYNRPVIAILGQVAAYAIPFLLSKGNGEPAILMGYISVVNAGLLLLAIFKDWKPVYRLGFVFSWIMHIAALTNSTLTEDNWIALMLLLTLNFLLFMGTFLAYKIRHQQAYNLAEITLLLLNSILFFAAGNLLLWDVFLSNGRFDVNRHHLTLFALSSGFIHFLMGALVKKMQLKDGSVQLFLFGLAIALFTVMVPIAWKGNLITIFWAAETAALATVFRKTGSTPYRKLAAVLLSLTLMSLAIDWQAHYLSEEKTVAVFIPFANMAFLSSLMVAAGLLWLFIQLKPALNLPEYARRDELQSASGLAFFLVLYLSLHLEIRHGWTLMTSTLPWTLNKAFLDLKLIAFAAVYATAWQYLNSTKLKNKQLHGLLQLFVAGLTIAFMTTGFTRLGEIREAYLAGGAGPAWLKLGIRYFMVIMIALLVWGLFREAEIFSEKTSTKKLLSVGFNALLLGTLCNEFIHWMDVLGYANQYKLGMSIIAAGYAFVLISIGILKNKKHLRISAILLLGATLGKVIFYDLSSMTSISKTIVLIILGIILLAASFLYNKFRERMSGEVSPEQNTNFEA